MTVLIVYLLQKLLPKLSSGDEKLHDYEDQDLSEEVYYSDEDASNLLPGDETTDAVSHMENVANPQQTEVCADNAALLSQLTVGFPSQVTIELAIAQLIEALTAEEKQLIPQMIQQMVMLNPVLAAAGLLALQVEAIRTLLTTRSQRALLQGIPVPAVQQMAFQTQLQNLPQNDASLGVTSAVAAQSASVMAQAESCPVPAAFRNQEDVPSQSQMLKTRPHSSFDESTHRAPVTQCDDSVALDTGPKYPDECSSTSSDHVQLGARQRPAGVRGRGMSLSGLQYNDEIRRQDRPRGRGVRRSKTGTPAAEETDSLPPGNGSATVGHPLVPPPLHTARQSTDSQGKLDEDWEEEIDEFGPDTFRVASSFFSGKR